jgi:uncharacterized protein (TIGR01777 family)
MTITVAGGSGFLGRALIARLKTDGHQLRVLTRKPRPGQPDDVAWNPDGSAGSWSAAIDGVDAVVNLAGEGIADRRWNDRRKRALLESRLLSTRSLAAAIAKVARPPSVVVNGSAVGFYGAHGDEIVTEATPPGRDFLATLCVAWEREADQASAITRVAIVRTGLVLNDKGGVLGKMLTPFRLGVGGPLGDGRQFMPWIHIADWVGLVLWLIGNESARGAFNGTAPTPVTNAEFSRALGNALHRPAIVPMPAFALRLLLGEFAESVLTGQRAVPARAEEMGYTFRFRTLGPALQNLFR